MGLVKGHYSINGFTELTSYCLEHYEEIEDIKDCDEIFNNFNDRYKKCNDRCIKALQVFMILVGTDDKLIITMKLTDQVLSTQFYDKVEEKILQYNIK